MPNVSGLLEFTMRSRRTVTGWLHWLCWLFLCIPGMKPRAVKRNVVVVLLYLLFFGLVFSMFSLSGVM